MRQRESALTIEANDYRREGTWKSLNRSANRQQGPLHHNYIELTVQIRNYRAPAFAISCSPGFPCAASCNE